MNTREDNMDNMNTDFDSMNRFTGTNLQVIYRRCAITNLKALIKACEEAIKRPHDARCRASVHVRSNDAVQSLNELSVLTTHGL